MKILHLHDESSKTVTIVEQYNTVMLMKESSKRDEKKKDKDSLLLIGHISS